MWGFILNGSAELYWEKGLKVDYMRKQEGYPEG